MKWLTALQALIGLWSFGLAWPRWTPSRRMRRLAAVVCVLSAVSACALFGVPWYFTQHLGLENGQGG